MAAPSPPYQVKALYEYSSPHNDDLSFPNGQILTVTDEEDADWCYGEYLDTAGAKQEGLFPRNFVKIYEPETPPRPSRLSRQKKEAEAVPATTKVENSNESEAPAETPTAPIPAPAIADSSEATETSSNQQSISDPPAKSSNSLPSTTSANAAAKTASSTATKRIAQQPTEKSVSGSFRDRINAFNKPAAAPVAPKPGVGSTSGTGFIKKPFVAPPPSKNAFIPPPRDAPIQKIYRREEDPAFVAQPNNEESIDKPLPTETPGLTECEDQPKPTSLKDRIALLQKQQMEQASRHAEAAQKKDKPKRPPKKRMESQERSAQVENSGQDPERITSAGSIGSRGTEAPTEEVQVELPSGARQQRLREPNAESPTVAASRGFQSDANDADQSGAGDTEDGEDLSTGRDDSDEKPRAVVPGDSHVADQAPLKEPDVGDEEDEADEEGGEGEEEEDLDPEVKRRMEIRERMAKMSGGMGMAGMFGPPGGMPGTTPKKQSSVPSETKAIAPSTTQEQSARAPPVPLMPMPGMQKVTSPEQNNSPLEVSKEQSEDKKSISQGRGPYEMPDLEDMEEEPKLQSRKSIETPALPAGHQDLPGNPLPWRSKEEAPPLPTERPVPPAPAEAHPHPPPLMSQSSGSESDDEMSGINRSVHPMSPEGEGALHRGREGPLPGGAAPSLPSRPRQPQSATVLEASRYSNMNSTEASPTSPTTPVSSAPRASRVPPIPGSSPVIPPPTPQNRAPPPPPPSTAPPSRVSTGGIPAVPQSRQMDDSDDEVTEYEGDYDTDIAADATHKDALKFHTKAPSLEDDSANDEASLLQSGLQSLGSAPRAVPPPPPAQPPRPQRQSSDMPRAPPPPPPPKEQAIRDEDDEYDPYNYTASRHRTSTGFSEPGENHASRPVEEPEQLFPTSPQRSKPPLPPQSNISYSSPPSQPPQPPPGRAPRQSMDVQRTSTNARRSTDAPRPSGEHGFIASDVDLDQGTQWWRQPNAPPPALQTRRDIIYEIEDTSTTRRGGRQAVTRVVYVLYMDYSQTIVTALFESRDPTEVAMEQHHEPPPPRMRQDQLEDAHTQFGALIAEEANSKKDTVVRDGQSQSLILELLSSHPDALLPVGIRAYGALVYANLANASVQQFDEIRPGDIVTFRNAKFQGHRGPMHSKYSVEVGKPDHVGVVVDWDGTKKKVRAWEQGRESKKVKMESFKLGDMRSGEAKVWRVMSRQWVGWEGQNEG